MPLRDGIDPLALVRGYPSFAEEKRYDIETEVSVHLARARAVQRIKFKRAVQIVAVTLLVGTVCALDWFGYWTVAIVPAVVAFGLVLWCYSAWEADSLLVDTFLADIVDPQRDSERRAELERVLAARQQPAPAPPPVLRVEAHVGNGRWRYADLPAPSRTALVWLARDVVAGRWPFAVRAAARHKFSRAQFDGLRDRFIETGWAVWVNEDAHAQGVLLTESGMDTLREIAAASLAEARRGC